MLETFDYRTRVVAAGLLAAFIFVLNSADGIGAENTQLDLKQSIEAEISKLENEIGSYNQEIGRLRGKSRTLESEISILNTEIKKTEAEIRFLNLSISRLSQDIAGKEGEIDDANLNIQAKKQRVGAILQVLSEEEGQSVVEMLLANDSLSAFFDTIANLESITSRLQNDLEELRSLKAALTRAKEELEEKKVEESSLREVAELEKTSLSRNRTQRSNFLTQTKGQEVKYQQLIKDNAARIAALREQLSALEREGIPVTEAVEVAKFVAGKVGVRPAFLLAVLEYESRLGQNVGTGSWRTDMKPCRTSTGEYCGQQAAFLEITKKLGLDPDKTKVSRKPYYGWGGAMGPAQFIPITWLLYEEQISAVTGHRPPSPWNTQDAFTAAALKLARDGASAKTPATEARAAKAYVSGNPNCQQYICNKYARDVLSIAARVEENIDQVASR